MKYLLSIIFSLILCTHAGAQNYSTDATLVSGDDNSVTLRASAVAEKKKDAALLAAKSAFYTLFHAGVAGVKNGLPMVAVERKDYDYRFFQESRYISYITSEVKQVGDIKVGKNIKITVQLSINLKSLIADLQHNNIALSPGWSDSKVQKATAALNPTIVIVPAIKASEGSDFEAMRKVADNNPALTAALDKVSAEFQKHGYKTRNYVSMLQNSKTNELMRTGSQSDVKTKIAQQLPGDIVVSVDADVVEDGQMVECKLGIRAVEKQTDGNLGVATFPSGKYYKGNVGTGELVDYAMKKIKKEFFDQIQKSFEDMISKGRECYVDITLSQSVTDWDFEQDGPASGKNFKEELDEWLRNHAQNGVYDLNTSTDKFIHMSVNVPLWNAERGRSYTLSNFSSDLRKFFKAQFGEDYKANITALGQKLEIVIE